MSQQRHLSHRRNFLLSKGGALWLRHVPRPGLEPGWVAPLVFETSASTDSAIWAFAGAKIHKNYKLQIIKYEFFQKECIFFALKGFFSYLRRQKLIHI